MLSCIRPLVSMRLAYDARATRQSIYKKTTLKSPRLTAREFLGVTELKDQQWKISVSYPEALFFLMIDEIIYEVYLFY